MRPFSSKQYQKLTAQGVSGNECCLCGRETSGHDAIHVPVNHELGEFVAEGVTGDAISAFPIGSECVKKYRKQFPA